MNTPDLNLAQLTEQFGTDEKCRKALEQLRWTDGPKCPRCKAKPLQSLTALNTTATSAITSLA